MYLTEDEMTVYLLNTANTVLQRFNMLHKSLGTVIDDLYLWKEFKTVQMCNIDKQYVLSILFNKYHPVNPYIYLPGSEYATSNDITLYIKRLNCVGFRVVSPSPAYGTNKVILVVPLYTN